MVGPTTSAISPLIRALEREDPVSAARAAVSGADQESADHLGRTPLIMAADKGFGRVVRLLLDAGSQVDARDLVGRTALMTAADRGHLEIVKMLLDKGAAVDATDSVGRTALTMALISGRRAVVDLLREKLPTWDNPDDLVCGLLSCADCRYGEIDFMGVERAGPARNLSPEQAGMEDPQLSLIVPTFNREKILDICLRSLAAQKTDGRLFEIVVVDNNSTDGTRDLVESYIRSDNRFVYVREENQGLSHARNRGFQAARGEYLAYLDDDVIVPSSYVSNMCAIIDKHKPDLIGAPVFPYYTDPKPGWYDDQLATLFHTGSPGFSMDCDIVGGNMAFRKQKLAELGMFDPRIGMKGTGLGFGGETQVVRKYRAVTPSMEQRVFYSPDCWVLHHVPAYKMRIAYILRRSYIQGAAIAHVKFPKETRTWPRYLGEARRRLRPVTRLAVECARGVVAGMRVGKRKAELARRAALLAGFTKEFVKILVASKK